MSLYLSRVSFDFLSCSWTVFCSRKQTSLILCDLHILASFHAETSKLFIVVRVKTETDVVPLAKDLEGAFHGAYPF